MIEKNKCHKQNKKESKTKYDPKYRGASRIQDNCR